VVHEASCHIKPGRTAAKGTNKFWILVNFGREKGCTLSLFDFIAFKTAEVPAIAKNLLLKRALDSL